MASLPAPRLQTSSRSNFSTELISRILEKTREEKIHWTRLGRAYSGRTLDGRIKVELTLAAPSFLGEDGWSHFAVKSQGKELFDIDNGLTLLTLAGVNISPTKQLIGELVSLLEERETQDVRDAIAALDNL